MHDRMVEIPTSGERGSIRNLSWFNQRDLPSTPYRSNLNAWHIMGSTYLLHLNSSETSIMVILFEVRELPIEYFASKCTIVFRQIFWPVSKNLFLNCIRLMVVKICCFASQKETAIPDMRFELQYF